MKVVTFNIEDGAFNSDPLSYAQYLKRLDVDVICIQESWWVNRSVESDEKWNSGINTAQDIAVLLNMNFHQAIEPYGCAILTKYPIVHIYDPNRVCGVILDINGILINVFNVHTNDFPGYHLVVRGFDYYDTPKDKSIEEMIELTWQNHKPDIDIIFDFLNKQSVTTKGGSYPTIIAGDFNEPSHFDLLIHKSKVVGRKYEWKTSQFLESQCFVDTYNSVYPGRLEYTNNVVRVYKDKVYPQGLPPARIDFIYSRGHKEIVSSEIKMDITLSDHQPVISEITF